MAVSDFSRLCLKEHQTNDYKLYQHFATPGEYQVLSKETGQPRDQTAGLTDDGTVKFLLCVMKNCGFRCSTAYVQGALSTV